MNPPDLLERLYLGENEAFELLYKKYYPPAAVYVRSNSGNEQDARDVFQQALLVLFKKTKEPGFRLSADPGAFLRGVVRNLWLYRLRTRLAHPVTSIGEQQHFPDTGADDMDLFYKEKTLSDKHHAIQQLIETLKPECQKLILLAYYRHMPSAEIAGQLGYTEAFIKVKKHRCMEALREKVSTHPAFNHDK